MVEDLNPDEKRRLLIKLLVEQKKRDSAKYSLSHGQMSLWFLQALFPTNVAFNESFAWKVAGKPNIEILAATASRLCQHHAVLRTTYQVQANGVPQAIVHPEMEIGFETIDASRYDDAQLQYALNQAGSRPFDLENGPIFRLTVFQREHEQIWHTSVHHIAIDLWSMMILMEDLRKLLIGSMLGQPMELAAATPYQQFCASQAEYLQSDRAAEQRKYWLGQIADTTPLELPSDRPRPRIPTFQGSAKTFTLNPATTAGLRQLASSYNTTLYTVLLSIFEVLLARYSGQKRFLVGSVLSGRTNPKFERTVGFVANLAALLADCSGVPSFSAFVKRTRETVLGALANQDYPFSLVVEQAKCERELGRPPLANAVFVLQNTQTSKRDLKGRKDYQPYDAMLTGQGGLRQTLNGLPIEIFLLDQQHVKVDLQLEMVEVGEGLTGIMRYNVALFDPSTIERLLGSFETLIQGVLDNPERSIYRLPLLNAEQRDRVVREFNATSAPLPDQRLFHESVRQMAQSIPDEVAIECDRVQWSYAKLVQQSDAIAYRIAELQSAVGSIAAIYQTRNQGAIASLLGSWRAGCATLALDPTYPSSRLAGMLEDARPSVVLTERSRQSALEAILDECRFENESKPTVVLIDDVTSGQTAFPLEQSSFPLPELTENSPAYVIYTSGSTGKPKGAVLNHAGLRNFSYALSSAIGTQRGDRVFQFANLCFDASLLEIVQAFGCGATLVMPASNRSLVGEELWQQLEDHRIHSVILPPSILGSLPSKPLQSLKILMVGGEACSASLVRTWAPSRKMFNLYGPTETTVAATLDRCEPTVALPSIGRPLANARVYILDQHQQPVPIGVVGEIYIGGAGVGDGYINRPELTAERFIPDPFDEMSNRRLYRTGDLAHFNADGRIFFRGRSDRQVKIRGFRVELGEIEATLLRSSSVAEAVVVAGADYLHQVVAFVVPKPGQHVNERALQEFCRAALPTYMVPTRIIELSSLPTNLNGKIDGEALARFWQERSGLSDSRTSYVPPRTEIETEICGLFERLLGKSPIGIHDSFFDLGGHSLLAAQLASGLQQICPSPLPRTLQLIYANPTVAGMASGLFNVSQSAGSTALIDSDVIQSLWRDSELDRSILPPTVSARSKSPPARVLLTGATGFLGIHLLHELLRSTSTIVHCLIRAPSADDALKRLTSRLGEFALPKEYDLSRIAIECGDLAEPSLGLSAERFDELALTIDAIYHNGALVNFALPYSQLKAANVLGTQEIIRLACRHTAKRLHYVSTLSVFPLIDTAGAGAWNETDQLTGPEFLWDGYSQSKWVAERLIAEVGQRGLPTTIYRPGRITGHSVTGRFEKNDLLMTAIQHCIQMGQVPAVDALLDMTPVDFVVQAIVRLSLEPDSQGRCFHLKNPHPIRFSALVDWLRSHGHVLKDASPMDWKRVSRDTLHAESINGLLALIPDSLLPEEDTWQDLPASEFNVATTLNSLDRYAVRCPPVDDNLLKLYLSSLERRQERPKLGTMLQV